MVIVKFLLFVQGKKLVKQLNLRHIYRVYIMRHVTFRL